MFKNSHFTKPMRTTLFVALILVLVALLSVALVTPKLAYAAADPVVQDPVDQFEGYIKPFVDKIGSADQISATTLYKKDTAGSTYLYSDLWINYFSAKTTYVSLMSGGQQEQAKKSAYWTAYQKLDTVLGGIYDVYVANTQLYNAAHPDNMTPLTYADWPKVQELDTKKQAVINENEKAVLEVVTDSWSNLETARKNLQDRYNKVIKGIETAIDNIAYLKNGTWHGEQPSGYVGTDKDMKIYYDSKASLDAVEKLINDNNVIVDSASKAYEGKAISGYEEDYLVAKNALEEVLKPAIAVNKAIKDVRDQVNEKKGEEKYYTLKSQIEAARKAYNDLGKAPNEVKAGNVNVNDLRKYVDSEPYDPAKTTDPENADPAKKNTYLGVLEEMEAKITAIEAEIDAAEQKITDIGKVEYTTTCSTRIAEAKAAFDALDADIKKHDQDEYAKAEGPKTYFVENYEDLCKAQADWNRWDDEVSKFRTAAIAAIQAFINANENAEAEAATMGAFVDLNTKYTSFTEAQQNSLKIGEEGIDNKEYKGETVKGITVPEGADANTFWNTHYNPNGKSYRLAYQHYFTFVDANYDAVAGFNERINNTFNNGDYTYGSRVDIKTLWDEYHDVKKTPKNLRPYVTNFDKLEQMHNDCALADTKVEEWIAAVNAITPSTAATINKMTEIKAAIDAFNALDTAAYVGAAFKAGGPAQSKHDKKPSDVVTAHVEGNCYDKAEATKWTTAYTTYAKREEEYNNIIEKCDALEDGLQALKLTPEVDFDAAKLTAWIKNTSDTVEKLYEELFEVNNSGKDQAIGEANQKYFQDNYADAWAIYQQAHKLYMRYDAENKILTAWTACGGKAEDMNATDKTKVKVTYEHATVIRDAIAAYDKYKDAYNTVNDIRNHAQLEALRPTFEELTAAMDAWIAKVVKLTDPNYDTTKIRNEKSFFDSVLNSFKGYPLDITATTGEYDKLAAEYTTLTSGDGSTQKEKYLSEAHAFFVGIYKKWDDEKTASQAKKSVKQDLEAFITEYAAYATNGTTLTADQVKTVKEKVAIYYSLHESQRAQIKEWSKVKNLVSQNDMADEFKAMVKNLYEDVFTNKNITSLTPYYVNALKSFYALLNSEYQTEESCRKAYEQIAEIEAEYEKAVAAKTVLNLQSVKAALEAKLSALETQLGTLTGKQTTLESTLTTLQQQVKDLDAAYKQAITEAIQALKDGDLKTMNEKLSTLQSDLTTKETELKGQISSLDSAIKDLQDKFAASEKADAELQSQIDALKKQSTGLMAGIIVVAIVAAALVACVAVLFIKRKSN